MARTQGGNLCRQVTALLRLIAAFLPLPLQPLCSAQGLRTGLGRLANDICQSPARCFEKKKRAGLDYPTRRRLRRAPLSRAEWERAAADDPVIAGELARIRAGERQLAERRARGDWP